jgi:C-terminal processing protease CtpA/Prc
LNTRNLAFCFLLTAVIGRAAPATTSTNGCAVTQLFTIAATNMCGNMGIADAPPKFDEVYQLLRTNLKGVSQTNLDRAAVNGLIEQFPGQVMLVKESNNAAASNTPDTLSKATLYDDSYAYLRIGRVEGHLAEKLRAAYQDLARTNKVKGVILDLRFAAGGDYAAAAAAADCFLNSEQPLLEWGTGSASATRKTDAIAVPVAILVNSQTTGAAEALAAALREGNIGLILGGTTAGQANIFKEFALGNGEKLRISTAQIKLGDGTALAHGLRPDIAVETSLTDEKAYLEDPYKDLHPPAPVANESAKISDSSATNQPVRRPTNEAELVREKRAGETADDESAAVDDQSAVAVEPGPPVIADAALARALDLLKGLAVLQQSHPG